MIWNGPSGRRGGVICKLWDAAPRRRGYAPLYCACGRVHHPSQVAASVALPWGSAPVPRPIRLPETLPAVADAYGLGRTFTFVTEEKVPVTNGEAAARQGELADAERRPLAHARCEFYDRYLTARPGPVA